MSKLTFKYIIVRDGAILMPECSVHVGAAKGFLDHNQKVYSAGFCILGFYVDGIRVDKVYGESTSLQLTSNPAKDALVINATFDTLNPIKYGLFDVNNLYSEEQR